MLYTALIFGIISSLHCIGMCGPIVLMLPIDSKNPAKKVLQITTYHLGRLISYGTIGLVFGILGKGLYIAGLQQNLSIVLGILMIIFVIFPEKKVAKYNFSKPIFKLLSNVKSKLGNQFKNKSLLSLLSIGIVNGFLPCAMIYIALFGAMAMQNSTYGMLYMIVFGLGTVPMVSSLAYLNQFFTISFRNKLQKAIPIVVVVIGILFILRGLGLGISYVSPSNLNLFIKSESNCF